MSRRVYRQFLLPEAQAHSFMKQTELSRWIAIMWWISRKKSATSVDKMRTGRSTSAQFEMPAFDRKNPSAGHKRDRCTAEETAADEEDVMDPAVLRDRVL